MSHRLHHRRVSHHGPQAMSDRQILFQHGMSNPEFWACFGTEAQRAEAAKRARWPDSFRCPRCSGGDHHAVGNGAGKVFQCHGGRHQTSLTAGSPLEHAKRPLTTRFLAIDLISQSKTGLSALALKRPQGSIYPTALLLHPKIDRAMVQHRGTAQLSGARQFDHARPGGERAGGKAAHGSEKKVPVVAGVPLSAKAHPLYPKVNRVSGFASQAIRKWASAPWVPGACGTSDGLGCFAAVTNGGYTHLPAVVGALKLREADPVQMGQDRPAQSQDESGRRFPPAERPHICRAVPLRFRQPPQPPLRSARPRCAGHRRRPVVQVNEGKGAQNSCGDKFLISGCRSCSAGYKKTFPRRSTDRLVVDRLVRGSRGTNNFAVQLQNPGRRYQNAA